MIIIKHRRINDDEDDAIITRVKVQTKKKKRLQQVKSKFFFVNAIYESYSSLDFGHRISPGSLVYHCQCIFLLNLIHKNRWLMKNRFGHHYHHHNSAEPNKITIKLVYISTCVCVCVCFLASIDYFRSTWASKNKNEFKVCMAVLIW